jgi:hypothetical protein
MPYLLAFNPFDFVVFYFCDPDAIRTRDLLLRRQLLYPAELRNQV